MKFNLPALTAILAWKGMVRLVVLVLLAGVTRTGYGACGDYLSHVGAIDKCADGRCGTHALNAPWQVTGVGHLRHSPIHHGENGEHDSPCKDGRCRQGDTVPPSPGPGVSFHSEYQYAIKVLEEDRFPTSRRLFGAVTDDQNFAGYPAGVDRPPRCA